MDREELKNLYSAIVTGEKEIMHRANIFSRQSPASFFDLSDPFAAERFVYGALTMPHAPGLGMAQMGSAVAQHAIKTALKKMNNPNRMVTDLFKKVSGLMDKKQYLIKNQRVSPTLSSPKQYGNVAAGAMLTIRNLKGNDNGQKK